jgi:hypothetical protein
VADHRWDLVDDWTVECCACGLDAREYENLPGRQPCTDED